MANPPAQKGIRRLLARASREGNLVANAAGRTQADEVAAIRRRCWDGALHTYATSYIFQRRARSLGIKLNWITYERYSKVLGNRMIAVGVSPR